MNKLGIDVTTEKINQMIEEREKKIQSIKDYDKNIILQGFPGSGKTQILVNRIRYMYSTQKIKPENVLVLTFSTEAVSVINKKMCSLQKTYNYNCEVRTLHSFALKIINKYHPEKNFILINNLEKLDIIQEILTLSKYKGGLSKEEFSITISKFKSEEKSPEIIYKELMERKNFEADPYERREFNNDRYKYDIYKKYENEKNKLKLYDFDDLIHLLKNLLKDESIIKEISAEVQYLLVDEIENFNSIELDILNMLNEYTKSFFYIYSKNLNIYNFRSSSTNNIIDKFKNFEFIELQGNIRLPRSILFFSNFIAQEIDINYLCKNVNEFQNNFIYKSFDSEEEERSFICKKIEELKKEHNYFNSDFAILYRNNKFTDYIELDLIKNKIPYKIKNNSFFENQEIKYILLFLEFIVNKKQYHLEKILYLPWLAKKKKSLKKLIKSLSDSKNILEYFLENCPLEKIKEVYNLIIKSRKCIEKNNKISDVVDLIENYLKYNKLEFNYTNINKLKNLLDKFSEEHKDSQEILKQLKLISNDGINQDSEDKVSVGTIHSSKGNEYKVVFIMGCNEGIIPSFKACNPEEIESERCLMITAITRAKEKCFISRAKYSKQNFDNNIKENKLSSFISYIPLKLIQENETKDKPMELGIFHFN